LSACAAEGAAASRIAKIKVFFIGISSFGRDEELLIYLFLDNLQLSQCGAKTRQDGALPNTN